MKLQSQNEGVFWPQSNTTSFRRRTLSNGCRILIAQSATNNSKTPRYPQLWMASLCSDPTITRWRDLCWVDYKGNPCSMCLVDIEQTIAKFPSNLITWHTAVGWEIRTSSHQKWPAFTLSQQSAKSIILLLVHMHNLRVGTTCVGGLPACLSMPLTKPFFCGQINDNTLRQLMLKLHIKLQGAWNTHIRYLTSVVACELQIDGHGF